MNKVLKHWWLQVMFSICAGSVLAQTKASPEPIQTVSTLQQALQAARHDTTRLALIGQLALLYQQVGKPDSAFFRLQYGLKIANRTNRPLDLGRIYCQLGHYYDNRFLAPQAINSYQKAIPLLQQSGKVAEAADVMYTLARVYTGRGLVVNAVQQITKNLAYAAQTGYYGRLGSAHALLYEIHTGLNEQKSMYNDLLAMLAVAREHHNPIDYYLAYEYFGHWYEAKHEYTKALPYWKKALQMAKQVQRPVLIAIMNSYIANNLIRQKRLNEAEPFLMKTFEDAKKDKRISIIYPTKVLARLREQQNRLTEAYQLIRQGMEHEQKNNPSTYLESLEILLDIQEKQGNYQQALATLRALKAVSDSLREVKKVEIISGVESRFALTEKEKDIALLKKNAAIHNLERAQIRQQSLIYELATAGLIIILFLLGWFGWHTRKNLDKLEGQQAEIKRQSKRLEELNAFKDKLFMLIGHDFRSPLMHLRSSLAQLDIKQRTTQQLTQQIDHLKRTADSLYSNMDNLLHWAALQRTGVFTRPAQVELHTLVAETVDFLEAAILQKNLLVAVDLGEARAWADEDQVQIVLRNILHNAIKFTPTGGQIRVHFQQSDTTAELVITDTGVGMSTTDPQQAANLHNRAGTLGETGTGLGLQVCDEFMKRNGGRMEIESALGKGTSVRLIFPVADRALAGPMGAGQ